MKIWASWRDNSVRIWRSLPISNPIPDLHNINPHTKFGENPLTFTHHPKTKIWVCLGETTPSKFDEICPLAISYQISTISIHIPSLVKIHWYLHKLSSGNENMGVSWGDNSVKIWRNLPISNPIADHHNIDPHTRFGENPLIFTQVIRKRKNGVSWGDNSVKNWRNLPISNPIPLIPDNNMYAKFEEIPWKIPQVIDWKWCGCLGEIKNWQNSPINNSIPLIADNNMYAKFEEIPWKITQIIGLMVRTDGRTYGWTDTGGDTIIPRHYRVAEYKNTSTQTVDLQPDRA